MKILKGKVGLVCHPASVDSNLNHAIDLFAKEFDCNLTCAFGPQHGVLGEKQDNMIESDDMVHPTYKIPIYSLYGEHRRPQKEMLNNVDTLVFDLQDVGCRIYTFLTTLVYCLEECADLNIKVVVLDRPNPAGRVVEGNKLDMNFESFVGAVPIPMRHGLTLGELANWYVDRKNLDVEVEVVKMDSYSPSAKWNEAWPSDVPWVNPSPNIPRLSSTQVFCGTVLIEGTWLSEGRGTTIPLEIVGAPNMDGDSIVQKMIDIGEEYIGNCLLRPCYFEPTFQKHAGKVCSGFQIHIDHPSYNQENFKVYRLICVYLKAINELYPEFDLFRPPPYEYEEIKMPFDILSGTDRIRNWVLSESNDLSELNQWFLQDESSWGEERQKFLLY